MATANDDLRAARERTASPTHTDECLSRQELAELVNAWIYEHHHKVMAASANYIGQLECGKIRWPGKLYREALRAIFSASKDSALGFVNTRRAVVKLENVKRKRFIETATVGGVSVLALGGPVAALLDLLEGIEPTPIPTRVGATEIEQIRAAAKVFSTWDFTYGGGLGREAIMAQLRWSAGLLKASCPARLRPELFTAVGDLAHRAGFMAFDAGAYKDASRVFDFALACAERAKDWHLRAHVLDSMALQAIRTGQPDEALTLIEHALVRADDRLTATKRAILHTDRARALAKMHRVQETLTAIGTAEEHFSHSTPANDPPFLANYCNAAYFTGNTGQALFDLAILDHGPERATDRLTAAVAEHHTAGRNRPLAICQAKLASLTMATGDPLQAATMGNEALNTASTVRSRRAADDLRELARYAATHQDIEEVAHLRHRIAALLTCTDSPIRQESTNPPTVPPSTYE